ncbi:hypothetical protein GPECTOR_89g508 [Gonium pectorale]|uniref:Uncharacterized protein n=1 Tax=Gonium pectorale TaxID=33097 RepID=A0A150G0X4_GONPE|nr:hypothetical protein GPECTOR_89g508 [Gonium pectorale]|eukprot:KXZ43488.1 hypothetical protein GPECTOR_89g508 [Gonium pectorale]
MAAVSSSRSDSVFASGLRESLAAGGATLTGPNGSALTGSALLPTGTYRPLDVQSVEVAGRLVVAGSGPGEGGGGEAAGGGSTAITTLDLTAFQDGPAFWVLNGSSLELHNLTLLLPPAPPEALTAQPPTVLSHVIGGSPARVTLSGVLLVLPTQTELVIFTAPLCDPQFWRRGDPQVRHGVVTFGTGSMPLAVPGVGNETSTSLPPPALLLRTRVTCCGEAGPQRPFPCGAAAVRDAAGLRATAAELMAEMGPAPSSVLVWLAANVTLDPDTWGGPLEVPPGVYLMLLGNPDPGAATQVDFAGIESAVHTEKGFVQIQDLVLLGLPYPSTTNNLVHTVAAWVHAVTTSRMSTGPAGTEVGRATRFSLQDDGSKPVGVLDSCLLLSLEESGAVASHRAAAAAATWPLLQVFEGDPAQVRLGNLEVLWDRSPETFLREHCTPHGVTVLVPTWFFAPAEAVDTEGATGNATLVVTNGGTCYGSPPCWVPDDSPCALMGWPASQAGRRTMWDMTGYLAQIGLPASSPLTLVDMVLYNLAPLSTPRPEGWDALLPPPAVGNGRLRVASVERVGNGATVDTRSVL